MKAKDTILEIYANSLSDESKRSLIASTKYQMPRNETGFYNLVQLQKEGEYIIATCLIDGDIENRFPSPISDILHTSIWDRCKNDWANEKIAEIKCTFIDIDGRPEDPIIIRVINKSVFNFVQW